MAETLKLLIDEILDFTEPVKSASLNQESLRYFFKRTGWNFNDDSGMPLANMVNSINQITQVIQTCQELIESEDAESLEKILQLLSSLKTLFKSVSGLVNSFDGANLNSLQIEEVVTDILHYLSTTYLQKKIPVLTQLLIFIEVIQVKKGEETQFNNAGKTIRYPYQFEILNFDNLSKFIQNPVEHFKSVYITPFDKNTVSGAKEFSDKLFPRIGNIASSLGAISVYGIKPAYGIDFGTIGNETASGALTLKMQTPLDEVKVGATVLYSPRDRGDLGWVIVPFGEVTFDQILGKYYFKINSALNVGGIIIADDGNVSFETANGLSSVYIDILAQKLPEDDTELAYLIGEREGTRLEIGSISISSKLGFSTEKTEFDVHFDLSDAKFVISGGGQDSFISKLIPSEGMEIPFDFLLGYSSVKGLYFNASAGLELAIPVHISLLDTIRIDIVYLKIKTQDYGIKAETSITGGASLGPLRVSFEEIGLQSKLDWTKKEKNLGFADFSLDFKPPNGLGLSIKTEAVQGSGFLKFDAEKQEYLGYFYLNIAGKLTLQATGIVTTKMPDGSKGYSLLVIINAQFTPAIQLGYGFTLNGVGGLLGLHRTMLREPLLEGVRTGTINGILFPENVNENIQRFVSDISLIFPPCQDRFLIGPMAKIGWGTPTLITLSVGLVIEIPGNIALLGVIRVLLPDEKTPLVRINVAFVGIIDFTNKLLSFDASLFDSRLLETMTLEGDMAVRVKWGDRPDFLLTVGGFHPSFTPPPLALPSLRRLSISILNTPDYKIGVECYQAITSNTVQFGARAYASFDLKACSIKGEISFDALFRFSPFYFIIQVSANFSLRAIGMDMMSVRVRMSLEGPTPWRAKGTGSVSILLWEVSADFDHTWGEERNTTLSDIAILDQFLVEFTKRENWLAESPKNNSLQVSLRELNPTEVQGDSLIIHPSASLVFRQQFVPLNFNLQKVGNQKPSDVNLIKLSSTSGTVEPVTDPFAVAQFSELTDAQKFSRPSFEPLQSGVKISLASNDIKTGPMVRRKIKYEQKIVDREPEISEPEIKIPFKEWKNLHGIFLKGASISRSPLSQAWQEQRQPFAARALVKEEQFVVASGIKLKPEGVVERFTNYSMAEEARHSNHSTNSLVKSTSELEEV